MTTLDSITTLAKPLVKLAALVLGTALAGCASDGKDPPTLKEGARDVGHAVGSAAREVGQGAKKAGKAVGEAAKEGGKAFKDAVKGED